MKKAVAVLLCMATVFSCVACKSTEETKKKKKRKTKKTTVITETDETEDPSDPSVPDTDPTTTETQPVIKELVISHDLTAEKISMDKDVRMYGAVTADEMENEYRYLNHVDVRYDVVRSEGGSSVISSILDEYVWHTSETCTRVYEQKHEAFVEKENKGEELFNYYYQATCEIVRADSQILSMRTGYAGYTNLDEDILPSLIYENYNAQDGSVIKVKDVILDTAGFKSLAGARLAMSGKDGDYNLDLNEEDPFPFGLTYDAVVIGKVKIPVAGEGAIFNMDYFGATPKNYTLLIDDTGKLTWDFDGDGTLEELVIGTDTAANSFRVENLNIRIDGLQYTFPAADFDEMSSMEEIDQFGASYVMSIEGKNYLLVCMDNGGEDFATYVFDINGVEPKFVDFFLSTPSNTLDPTHFTVDLRTYIMGTIFMDFDFGLDKDGHLVQYSSLGRCHSGPYMTTVPLTGNKCEFSTGDLGDEFEVVGGTRFEILGYDNNSGMLYIRLHPKSLDMETDDVALQTDKKSKIAGQSRYDAFIGLPYAD